MQSGEAGDLATPPSTYTGLSGLTVNPKALAIGMRAALFLSNLAGGPIRIGDKVLVARHADVRDVLSRDLEFRIAPVNGTKIDAVNGPFILGMDRDVALARERSALYRALAKVDLQPFRGEIARDAEARIARAGDQIDAVGDFARPVAAATAKGLFGIGDPTSATFLNVVRALFAHIFLNLNDDKAIRDRALKAKPYLAGWFDAELARRHQSGDLGHDMMGAMLGDRTLRDELNGDKALIDDLTRRTLGGMLVGSIDTTATCVAKIMTVIGQDAALAAAIAADVDDRERLGGWCREALRRWPHNPLVLRSAAMATTLAGVKIKTDDKVYVLTQAAMFDSSVFPDPLHLDPGRPLKPYLHFGGGLHPCAGQVVNAFQIPLLIGALVRRGVKSVGKIDWAGPFPDHLPITFHRQAA